MALHGEAKIYGRKRETDKGQIETFVYNAGALVAKTMYKIDYGTYGPQAVAIADDTDIFEVCIPEQAADAGAGCWVVTYGFVDDATVPSATYTTDHAWYLLNGAITSTSAVYAGNGYELGSICETAAVATTSLNIFLNGMQVQNQHA